MVENEHNFCWDSVDFLNASQFFSYISYSSNRTQELNILKNRRTPLNKCLFFELVLQTLRKSKSYDMRIMSIPVHELVHRLQSDYIVGLVSLLSYAYYTGCGTRCQELGGNEDVSQLCDARFAALQSEASLQQQQFEIAFLNQKIETQTLVASAHHWAYGELLGTELPCGHIISRQKLCEAIYENWQTLDVMNTLLWLMSFNCICLRKHWKITTVHGNKLMIYLDVSMIWDYSVWSICCNMQQ